MPTTEWPDHDCQEPRDCSCGGTPAGLTCGCCCWCHCTCPIEIIEIGEPTPMNEPEGFWSVRYTSVRGFQETRPERTFSDETEARAFAARQDARGTNPTMYRVTVTEVDWR